MKANHVLEPTPCEAPRALPSARAALRAATRDVHERLHHHPALSRLAAGTIETDEYRHLLARSYGFYASLGPLLGPAGHLTSLLFLDLEDLGMVAAEVACLPRCAQPLGERGYAAVLGATYVLLGASLGGKVMARALSDSARGASVLPVRFLTGIDAGDWTDFARTLDAKLPGITAQAEAASAAVSMFAAYEDWMAG